MIKGLRQVYDLSPYVFPSKGAKEGTLSRFAVQKAFANLRNHTEVSFVIHDLRRTAASHMTSMCIPRLVVSRILNHVEPGITGVYGRHSYDAEKRDALERWGHKVMSVIGEGEPAKVVPLRRDV